MGFLLFIQSFARHRFAWLMLLLLGLGLEGCGLYFQYELRLAPCVNCVYERAFYLSFIAAGLIGFLCPSNFLFRNLANLIFLSGSVGGTYIALEHLNSLNITGFGASCKLTPDFPSYLKLDEWLPWMFSPTGTCGPLDWSLFGFNMPQCILFSFACGIFVSLLFLMSEFAHKKRRNYYY